MSDDICLNGGNRRLMKIDGDTSERFTMLRFFLIVFVVFIHNNVPVLMGNSGMSRIPGCFWVCKIFIAESIGSCVVPLFYFISGYLLYAKNERFGTLLRKKFRSLFVPYVLWTLIAVAAVRGIQLIPHVGHFFMSSDKNFGVFSVVEWVDIFIGRFTARAPYPFVYQFWFLRDLMLVVILSPVIKKLIDWIPFCFIALVLVWWLYFPYGQVSSAVLFFALGYYAVRSRVSMSVLDGMRFRDIGILYGVLAIGNVVLQCCSRSLPEALVPLANSVRAGTIFSGAVFFMKCSGCWAQNKKAAAVLRYLSGFSFWLYAIHEPVVLSLLLIGFGYCVPVHGSLILLPYFLLVVLCSGVALGSGIVVKRLFPRVFALLTGGRNI